MKLYNVSWMHLVAFTFVVCVALIPEQFDPAGVQSDDIVLSASEDLLRTLHASSFNSTFFTLHVTHRHVLAQTETLLYTFKTLRFTTGRTTTVWSADPEKYDVTRDDDILVFSVFNVSRSDAGVYSFYDVNDDDRTLVDLLTLKVLFDRPLITTAACFEIVEEASCTLVCKTFDFSRDTFNFTWHFQPKHSHSFLTLHQHTNPALPLTSVTPDDAGNYTCVTSSLVFNFSAESGEAAVNVVYAAKLISPS